MKKLLLLGGILSSAIMLGACTNSTDTSGENVVKGKNGFEINEGQALKEMTSLVGSDVLKSSLVLSVLDKEFKVSKSEIDKGLETLDKTYAEYGGVEYIKEYYGYSDEEVKNTVKRQLIMDKALMKYKGVTEDKFKSYFEENKAGKIALEVYIPLGKDGATKEEVEKVKGLLKTGVTEKDIKDLGIKGLEVKDNVEFKQVEMTDMPDLFKTPVGEVYSYEDEKMIVLELVTKDVEYKYEDLLESIKTKLIYNDESPEIWLFDKVFKSEKSYTLSDEYNYLLEEKDKEESKLDNEVKSNVIDKEVEKNEDVKEPSEDNNTTKDSSN